MGHGRPRRFTTRWDSVHRRNDLADGLLQERTAAEGHTKGPKLIGDDLVLRTAVEIDDLAGTLGDILGDASDVLIRTYMS